ncbi:MAG: amino acid adenylation domain-containing protein, partial [Pseudanabaenales cyanobacterium]|nr:amino acid adenylation domain-containing protein [Pseudanabaenales cyanobacterium]
FEGEQLTYRQLNGRANQLARHLQTLGVGPDVLVGVCMERSIEMAVGLLGILKAGGAYAPLDPTYPSARLAFMLQDTQVSVLLTQDWLLGVLPEHTARTLCLNQDWQTLQDEPDSNLTNPVTAEHLAYVIYTSGSTGAPKGVMNTHQGICNRLLWMQDTYPLTLNDRVLQKTPFSFDVSVWEFFWTLMTGACLIMARPGGHQDSAYLAKVIAAEKITTVHFVPSMLSMFLEEPGLQSCDHLKRVMCSGEALSLSLQARFFARLEAALHNLYGPTEAAIDVTFWACERESHRPIVPIGRPIANTQIYLLDAQLQPVPVGVPGELHIGGIGLARGYLNRPNLTTEKFIPNPYRDQPDARLYKTGDLARYLPDGAIEYLGRIDHQVKIRGCRIELGEIEAALGRHPNLQAAIVLVREPESHQLPAQVNLITNFEETPITEMRRFLKGAAPVKNQPTDKQLVAYCVAHQQPPPTTTELRRFLKETLPDFMIPSVFVRLEALPLTANGKVNHRALPSPGQARPDLEQAFVAPRTPVEIMMAEVWAQVLGLEKVGIQDNFFELGGDSIRSIQVAAKAQARGFHFGLEQLFQHQTIATLVPELTVVEPGALSTQKTQAFSLISLAERQQLPAGIEDAYPLGKTQAGVIFHSQAAPNSPMYRDIFQYRLQVGFNASLFESAVQQIVDRHPILRTSFDLATFSEPLQLVHQTVHVRLHVEDLRTLSSVQQTGLMADWIKTEQSRSFNWSHPPLIRFFIHRLTDASFYLTLSFHDCILDGWSASSLLTELLHRYCTLLQGEAVPPITPPPVTFRDFVGLEQSTLASPVCQDYWTRRLNDCIIRSLPRWTVSTPKAKAPEMGVLHVEVLPQVSDGLKALARLAQVPVKHVLLAAHVRVMSLLTGESDVLTGLESNGRLEALEAEQTLGMHLNTAPFRLKLAGGTWMELAQQVFEAERELLPYRRYPYSELKKLKGGEHLFETVFNYTHFHVYEQLQALKDLEILGAQGFGETHFTFRAEFNQNHASGQIQLDLECDLTQIGKTQLAAIGAYYSKALTAMANQPFGRYETECLLPEQERHQLLVEWNQTQQDYPLGCIHYWFEDQVARQPNAIALIWENERLSYQDLNQRANALAHYLQKLGVHPEVPVALCVERSPDMIVGVLGILKAGGAYVPLDPTYPKEHLKFILEDVNAAIILTQVKVAADLPPSNAQIICLDSDWRAIAQASPNNPIHRTTPEQLAYIIYTSGSTGHPKGVLISHQSLVNSTSARITYYSQPVTRFLLVPSIAFDSSVAGIFGTLCQGGALVLFREGRQKEIWRLASLIDQQKVSHWLSVPSLYKVLLAQADPSQLSSLKTVIVAGEACSGELIERHQQLLPETALFNEYGPTEGTVWSSVYQVQKHELSPVIPIGRPIANTQIYILDAYLQPVPIGVAGELYIAGLGIAKGYLNRPELTAERFISNPFNCELGARLYKTGDLARYRPDGDLEFLGRLDHQVKLRGYRIELTAIEAILKQHPSVEEAVAWVKTEASGGKQLIAYVVPIPGSILTTDELQRCFRHKSPSYMIPNVFAILDTLPLTSSGKVDRQRLPALEQVQSASGTMARLLKMLEHLSDDEVKAMLAQNKPACELNQEQLNRLERK